MTIRCRGLFVLVAICPLELAVRGGLLGAEETSPPFQPAEISIGEPLPLPDQRFPAASVAPQPEADLRRAPGTPPTGGSAVGNGWIGLTVDDKVVTGRLVVVDVAAAGPADRAGIRRDDHLLALDGMPLQSADQLAAALAAIAPGSAVKVAIGRGTQVEELTLVARSRPAKPPARELAREPGAQSIREPTRDWQPAETTAPPLRGPAPAPRTTPPTLATPSVPAPVPVPGAAKGRTALGVRTLPIDPTSQERFRLAEPAGALVIGVVQDLPASKAGVPPGSVIVALDNQPVRSPSELTRIVTSGPVGRPVTLQYILPGGEQRRAEVSLQSLEVPLEQALISPTP